jgi:hypothetical protein
LSFRLVIVALLLAGSSRVGDARQAPFPDPDLRTDTYWALGYATNAPRQLLGISTLFVGSGLRNWGVYVDTKATTDSPESEPGFSLVLTPDDAEAAGHLLSKMESTWRSLNVALVRAVAPNLALYAGAGYSQERAFARYFDFGQEIGNLGYYWVHDEARSGGRLNLLAGAWFRITSHIFFQFGGEMAPGGFTAGVAYAFPLRH